MATRRMFRRSRFRSPKRATEWTAALVNTEINVTTGNNAIARLVVPDQTVLGRMRDAVIERIVGNLTVSITPTSLLSPVARAYFGVGLTVVDYTVANPVPNNYPQPFVDGAASWMWWNGGTLRAYATGAPGEFEFTHAMHRFDLDIKVKRKINSFNEQLALVINNSANGNTSVNMIAQLRVLLSDR